MCKALWRWGGSWRWGTRVTDRQSTAYCIFQRWLQQHIQSHLLFRALSLSHWEVELFSSPLELSTTLWLHQWIECSGSDVAWLLGLGHKRGLNLALTPSVLICSPLTPTTMLWGSPRHMRRPHIRVLANRSSQQLASTAKHESKWAFILSQLQFLSFLAEVPDIVK